LEQDASHFGAGSTGFTPNDPSCKLCNAIVEDRTHFIALGSTLSEQRQRLLRDAPPTMAPHLPDHVSCPEEFTNYHFGTWYNDLTALCLPNWNL